MKFCKITNASLWNFKGFWAISVTQQGWARILGENLSKGCLWMFKGYLRKGVGLLLDFCERYIKTLFFKDLPDFGAEILVIYHPVVVWAQAYEVF